MKLTPLDIHHKEFHRAIRGYNEEEVDLFLDQVYSEFERIFKENNNLKDRVEQLESKVNQFEGIEQTLQNTLITAQKSAEDVQINAKKEADLILKDAEMKARQTIEDAYNQRRTLSNSLNNLKAIEEEFINNIATTVESFKDRAEKAKADQGAVEKRIAKEMDKLPEMEELLTKDETPADEKTKKSEKPKKEAAQTETNIGDIEQEDEEVASISSEVDVPETEAPSVIEAVEDDVSIAEVPVENDDPEFEDQASAQANIDSGMPEVEGQPSADMGPDFGMPEVDDQPSAGIPSDFGIPEAEENPSASMGPDFGMPEVGDQPLADDKPDYGSSENQPMANMGPDYGIPVAEDLQSVATKTEIETPESEDRQFTGTDEDVLKSFTGTEFQTDSNQQVPPRQDTAELVIEQTPVSPTDEEQFSNEGTIDMTATMPVEEEEEINTQIEDEFQGIKFDDDKVENIDEADYRNPFDDEKSTSKPLASNEEIDRYLQQEEPVKEGSSGFLDRIKSGFKREADDDSNNPDVNSAS